MPGIKDSTGDPARLAIEIDEIRAGRLHRQRRAAPCRRPAMGATGAILALANVDPEGCIRAWEGDGACQRELVNGHRSGALSGIRGLKWVLNQRYGTSTVTRL